MPTTFFGDTGISIQIGDVVLVKQGFDSQMLADAVRALMTILLIGHPLYLAVGATDLRN